MHGSVGSFDVVVVLIVVASGSVVHSVGWVVMVFLCLLGFLVYIFGLFSSHYFIILYFNHHSSTI